MLAVPVIDGAIDVPHGTVNGCGQVITGGVVSTTVIVWLQLVEFPHASIAVHVRVTE